MRNGSGQCIAMVYFDQTSPPPRNSGDCPVGNPIYPLRGTKVETVDLGVDAGWHRLTLVYSSEKNLPAAPPPAEAFEASVTPPGFGALWYGSLHRGLRVDQGLLAASVSRGGGQTVTFTGTGNGLFTTSARNSERLLTVAGGFRFHDTQNATIESYDTAGRLLRIDHAGGGSLAFRYSGVAQQTDMPAPGPGYLIGIVDAFERAVRFGYNADGYAVTVVAPGGEHTEIAYTAGNLTSLTWPDQRVRQFLYEAAAVPWALTGIVGENESRKSTFGYDNDGRATSTVYAGNVNRFGVSYAAPPNIVVTDTFDATNNVVRRVRSWQVPVSPVINTPTNASSTLVVGTVADNPVVQARSQPAGSGCAASGSGQALDSAGNLLSRDDFNGNRTCYANDVTRNLEVVRVEGLATGAACAGPLSGAVPTGARKTTTQWHPLWRLASKVAEPSRITTSVYNGQPDPFAGGALANCVEPGTPLLPDGSPIAVLCRQVEQATLDADGSQGFSASLDATAPPREQRWTYNRFGQVLTHDGPRTDIADVTTHEYYADTAFTGTDPNAVGHTLGDLKKTTNPAGQVTQYTLYNKAGQVLQSIDPNGIVTDQTYDARQRLLTVTTAGLTTRYDYWPTGLLKKLTLPDGSFLSYGYDDAHRLTSISDDQGNSVTYILDNVGNRTDETFKDPSQALRRQLGRAADALGRIQQVTGRE